RGTDAGELLVPAFSLRAVERVDRAGEESGLTGSRGRRAAGCEEDRAQREQGQAELHLSERNGRNQAPVPPAIARAEQAEKRLGAAALDRPAMVVVGALDAEGVDGHGELGPGAPAVAGGLELERRIARVAVRRVPEHDG